MKHLILSLLIITFSTFMTPLKAEYILRENMLKAEPGDYIVASQNKNFVVLMIYAKDGPILTIEEATIPENRVPSNFQSWKTWLADGAQGNTCWIRYRLNVQTGQMLEAYSFTRKSWFHFAHGDNILGKLIYLDFQFIAEKDRKKAGAQPGMGIADRRPMWQPRLVVEGQQLRGVPFNGWKSRWPNDNSDLSGKQIEIYLPIASNIYPSYFPYWLEVQGMTGSAKVRIVDSGKGIKSPMPPQQRS